MMPSRTKLIPESISGGQYCADKSIKSSKGADRSHNFDGLVQDRSNSIANAPELLQSCTNPSI